MNQRYFKALNPSSGSIFVLSFCWALLGGLLLQFVVLPALPSLHAGHGLLLGGDWVVYQSSAVKLALQMTHDGWGIWELRPQGNAPIGLLAALYFVVGIYEPWVFLPINAFLFGTATFTLHKTYKLIIPMRHSFFAVLPFVMFPSALMIYGQVHKDIFSITGTILIIFVWADLAGRTMLKWHKMLVQIAILLTGVALVWIVRPYLLQPLLLAGLFAALLLSVWGKRGRRRSWWCALAIFLTIQLGEVIVVGMSSSSVLGSLLPSSFPSLPSVPSVPAEDNAISSKILKGNPQQVAAFYDAVKKGYIDLSRIDVSRIDQYFDLAAQLQDVELIRSTEAVTMDELVVKTKTEMFNKIMSHDFKVPFTSFYIDDNDHIETLALELGLNEHKIFINPTGEVAKEFLALHTAMTIINKNSGGALDSKGIATKVWAQLLPNLSSNMVNESLSSIVMKQDSVPSVPSVPSVSVLEKMASRMNMVSKMNGMRVGFAIDATRSPKEGSNIDIDVRFTSIEDVLLYLPRALQIGLLAPFPSMWLRDARSPGGGSMRIVSAIEMTLSYVFLLGWVGLWRCGKERQRSLMVAVAMSLVLTLILTLVVTNVGTVYRMRWGTWQLLNGFGILGWGLWLQSRRKEQNK